MARSRIRRCSIEFDDLVRQTKQNIDRQSKEIGIRRVPTETEITSIFARELRKKKMNITWQ